MWSEDTIKDGQARYQRLVAAAHNPAAAAMLTQLADRLTGASEDVQAYALAQGKLSAQGGREFKMEGNKVSHFFGAVCWFALAGKVGMAQSAADAMRRYTWATPKGNAYKQAADCVLRAMATARAAARADEVTHCCGCFTRAHHFINPDTAAAAEAAAYAEYTAKSDALHAARVENLKRNPVTLTT